MTAPSYRTAFIIGAGAGLSASLARLLTSEGLRVALGARDVRKLEGLVAETGALAVGTDAADPASVSAAFRLVDSELGTPDVVIYNASGRVRGAFVDLDAAAVRASLDVTAYGGFLAAQEAARRMLPRSSGAIVFTGASASVKGYSQSAPFAMGKFALRGLAQSLARELAPQGIHVAHFVIDGGIRSASRQMPAGAPDSLLDPDAIARTYLHVLRQDRSAWTWEVELRPWVERF
jgi:NAD(P)-dependent dehydrogenase (short-subunit alcohol dehydrogenase family)